MLSINEHNLHQQKVMTTKRVIKLVREGNYVAEVLVEYLYTDTGWSPYLSLVDAQTMDAVREALRAADLEHAALFGRVYELTPVS